MKSPNVIKSQALDGLLSLKLISKERNHEKAGFFSSVFQAMFQKAVISDDDFKQYMEVLLGNKDDEKVMELMSKAEKAMLNSRPNRRDGGRRCYTCGGYGHFQPVHLGSVTSGARLLVAQTPLPTEEELVMVRMAGVCCKWMAIKKLTNCCT